MIARVLEALRAVRFRATTEAELQEAIGFVLELERLPARREVRLSKGDVIDFMVGGIGVEVKIDGSGNALLRQIHRYAQHEGVR